MFAKHQKTYLSRIRIQIFKTGSADQIRNTVIYTDQLNSIIRPLENKTSRFYTKQTKRDNDPICLLNVSCVPVKQNYLIKKKNF